MLVNTKGMLDDIQIIRQTRPKTMPKGQYVCLKKLTCIPGSNCIRNSSMEGIHFSSEEYSLKVFFEAYDNYVKLFQEAEQNP